MAKEGWIKLHRKILDSALYKSLNSKQRDIMIQCLLMANHTENEWIFNGVTHYCKAGQFYTSLEKLRDNCAKDVTIQNVRTCLVNLEKADFLTNTSTKVNRLITITKWASYQEKIILPNNGANKDLTKTSQSLNKDLTTNKNDKKDKEGKKLKEFHSNATFEMFNGLSDIQAGAVVQLFKITKQTDVNSEQVNGLWEIFKIQNLTGKKHYTDEDAVYSHFINWTKTQNISPSLNNDVLVKRELTIEERQKKIEDWANNDDEYGI